ncbi:uncharacterized protein BJ212DRAFT_489699 [Suillus subaureus]|nr:uncharacterized protein BJ212DRAFT_489699 [Suillus subaureus]KAG1811787.1 hypothetical protein BJ212DRAFT_489699 [Suillus subaureus]
MVLWEEVEIGEEGLVITQGWRREIGLLLVWLLLRWRGSVEVGMVEVSSFGDEMVVIDIVMWEAELDEGMTTADIAEWEAGPDEADTGKAAGRMSMMSKAVGKSGYAMEPYLGLRSFRREGQHRAIEKHGEAIDRSKRRNSTKLQQEQTGVFGHVTKVFVTQQMFPCDASKVFVTKQMFLSHYR